jgi:ABC-type long-subunit fatty acid transport system fused permease/ATPase subunit
MRIEFKTPILQTECMGRSHANAIKNMLIVRRLRFLLPYNYFSVETHVFSAFDAIFSPRKEQYQNAHLYARTFLTGFSVAIAAPAAAPFPSLPSCF